MIATLTGFLAGFMHVLSGPDHLAAVAPLSVDHGKEGTWRVGLRWGLGHATGVILLGVLLLALREILPLEAFSHWAERLVGVMVIGIGLWGVRKALTKQVHVHVHAHGAREHAHVHVHDTHTGHDPAHGGGHFHTHAVFAVGVLHGLAGGAHILGLLPVLVFSNRWLTASYLLSYALGTIFAMASFSSLVGMLAKRCSLRGSSAYRFLMLGCSAVAVLLGGYWLLG